LHSIIRKIKKLWVREDIAARMNFGANYMFNGPWLPRCQWRDRSWNEATERAGGTDWITGVSESRDVDIKRLRTGI